MATSVLSGSRAGVGSAVATAPASGTFQVVGVGTVATAITAPPLGESIWDSGLTAWDGGASRWDYTAPIVLALAASLTATSQARAAPLGIRINLAGQITATSRGTANLPRSITLAARLTSVSSARAFYAPPPNRVLAGRVATTSSAAAHATITSISGPRQTEVSIIT